MDARASVRQSSSAGRSPNAKLRSSNTRPRGPPHMRRRRRRGTAPRELHAAAAAGRASRCAARQGGGQREGRHGGWVAALVFLLHELLCKNSRAAAQQRPGRRAWGVPSATGGGSARQLRAPARGVVCSQQGAGLSATHVLLRLRMRAPSSADQTNTDASAWSCTAAVAVTSWGGGEARLWRGWRSSQGVSHILSSEPTVHPQAGSIALSLMGCMQAHAKARPHLEPV